MEPISEIREYLLPSSSETGLKDEGIDELFDECLCLDCCSKKPIVSLPCGHRFHGECISTWIEQCEILGPTCPMCRRLMIKEDYEFWFKLGRETCNLKKWGDYCSEIISRNFGKSSKYAKLFPRHSAFLGVRADLDSLIQQSYDLDEDDKFNKHLKEYLETSDNVNCCMVFFCISTIVEPEIPYHTGRYPKTITRQQKCYIDEFRNRLKLFIDYLEYIANTMKMPKNTMRWKESTGRNSLKDFNMNVKKLKKWYDKLILLDELNLS